MRKALCKPYIVIKKIEFTVHYFPFEACKSYKKLYSQIIFLKVLILKALHMKKKKEMKRVMFVTENGTSIKVHID